MSKAEIDAARRAAILARVKLTPKGACHFCGFHVHSKGALWCATDCATEYEKERADLMDPKAVVLGVLKGEETVPVVTTHRKGAADEGSLQAISAELLEYYQALDRAARAFVKESQIG